MDNTMCRRFDTLRNYLPDELDKTALELESLSSLNNYCSNGESEETKCKTDLDKINAGFLWLFDQLFVKNKKDDINIAEYIIIWLSYMLNLKKESKITKLNDFYSNYIEINTHYTNCNNDSRDPSKSLKGITGYNNYKEIIDKKKELFNINSEYMSKFYDAFKTLCNMYTELDANKPNNKNYLDCAKKFVEKYKKFNGDSRIIGDNSYKQILSTLSNDYNNFKNFCSSSSIDCSDVPSLPDINTIQNPALSSEPSPELSFEVTSSSSSIASKLIPVLSIFGAIAIFLGISYKYSLFGFRKRTQKQHLREKIKR
ncbi:PIR protein [Plasmodium yoelii]|uniref:Yir1 protein n=3 Tax=Plasmodium yoelii TaxID=5861 RepID=Q7RHS7_PLAYO|nr:PIR protein [Plasmodium yoelii]EAA15693.1 putative yir1 protein [Plasmodium yoelii yoelii]WBY55204.1 PIR protein [Plasmodium yoelii yoelii]CDU16391.1 YIR protein [Plasmodium yoelii]VTZ73128.1 PIR protein [Plasmodium yoelii]|eukprot:XP_022811512.1 PIR protein [Plasmodium yoelii]